MAIKVHVVVPGVRVLQIRIKTFACSCALICQRIRRPVRPVQPLWLPGQFRDHDRPARKEEYPNCQYIVSIEHNVERTKNKSLVVGILSLPQDKCPRPVDKDLFLSFTLGKQICVIQFLQITDLANTMIYHV